MESVDVERRLDDGDVLLTVRGAAELLGSDDIERTVNSLKEMRRRRDNTLPFVKLGKSVRYWRSDVIEYIARNTYRSTFEYAR